MTEFDTSENAPQQSAEQQAPVQTEPKKSGNSSQRFTMQADTLDVQKKNKPGTTATSISVKASAPKKFYTVEVGAFKMQGNVKRHQQQLTERFKLPVRVLFDSTINLTRVCVGTFSTKSGAEKFLKQMKERFPKDYVDLWISYWTK